jgi:hypothetical protein
MPSLQEEIEKKLGIKNARKRADKRKPIINLGAEHKKGNKNDNSKTIRCRHCNLHIVAGLIQNHLRKVHPEKKAKTNQAFVKCDICGISVRKNLLDIHKKKTHPNTNKKIPVKNSNDILHLPFDNKFKFTLSADKDFKNPDKWVSKKVDIQEHTDDSMNIYIGLDFGTSYTKAVIRCSQDSYVVDWSGISNFTNPNTLPSELAIAKNNQTNTYNVGHAPDSEIFSNLKIPLLEGTAKKEEEGRVVIYLSLVLRYIRQWWYKNNKLPVSSFSWHLNVGLPAKVNKDDKILKQYEHLINVAWENSCEKDNALNIKVNCFSEFLAQMQTYLKNPQRENDLHLLCDVGAGTVDVVGFNVHTDDNFENLLPEFSAEVENIGTHYLFQRRLMSLDTKIQSSKTHDATQVLTAEDFAREYKADIQLIQDADKGYVDDLSTLIIKVLGQIKSNRYGNSPAWNGILRTFICGGAAKTPVVQAAISKVKDNFKSIKNIDFPVPNNIQTEGVDVENFQRISVAYGLAFDVLNMPKYKDENKPWKPPKLPIREDLGGNYDK